MAVMAPLAVLPGSIALLPSRAVQKQQQLSSSCCVFRKSSSGIKIRRLRGVGEIRREGNVRFGVRAAGGDESGSATGAGGDSIVSEVAVLAEEPETPGVASSGSPVATKERKSSPLSRGGTLSGKDPSKASLGAKISQAGPFEDPRWIKGNWDLSTFTKDGKVNWDGVIDAEVKRRKWLEDNPEASSNDEPVLFETSTVPWWAWVKRFHLPEAELLNGRAAMVGYFAAYVVDSLTGVGLVDQQSSFLGKLLLFITVVAILIIRKNEDLETIKAVAKESTFYDKQWQATWKEDPAKVDKPLE